MSWSIKLFTVRGIDVKVHLTFVLILIWAAYLWGVSRGQGLEGAVFGVVVTLLLFLCVTLHELGHSSQALRFGVPVKDITLWPFGGLSQMERMPEEPRQELQIAIAGPIVNLIIGVVLALLAQPLRLQGWLGVDHLFQLLGDVSWQGLLAYLITANFALAAFNLIPAFPRAFVASAFLAPSTEISYSEFKTALREGEIESVTVSEDQITGTFTTSGEGEDQAAGTPTDSGEGETPLFGLPQASGETFRTVRVEDPDLIDELEAAGVDITGEVTSESGIGTILGWILPLALMFGFWYWMMGRMKQGGGLGDMFSFGKSKARKIEGEEVGVSFKDVGGVGEAVVELHEITDFLEDPTRFQRLGGEMPKDVLLVGPPGTGKTLLARATAGETGVPFFSLSAAEFIEMFVGVGASRVRDLFDKAKKEAPSIIFIDEIDAIGGRRGGAAAGGSHEEREQTLNQLLAEMDGFESSAGVIVLAATNRPEVLDPALLRPGRFDRQITVDLPDLVGRQEILHIHARGVTLADDVDLSVIARITPGFSGADLANVVNEAALLAARHGKEAVEMRDFDAAIERVIAGSERRTRAMNEQEKRTVTFHEAGHALVASLLPGADPVHKVTIVPRGRALGYTWHRPTEDRYLLNESELHAQLAMILGGRAAEALVFDEVSTGAADDLDRATDLARRMVTEYGMSPALGPVRLAADPQTAAQVDTQTREIVEKALSRAWDLLESLTAQLLGLLDDHLLEVMLTLVLVFGTFLLAESLHLSGVIAVGVAGLAVGNYGLLKTSRTSREDVVLFWEIVVFLVNSLVFLLIGFELRPDQLIGDLLPIAIVIVVLLAARALIVYGLGALAHWQGRDVPRDWRHVIFWGGLRGAVPVALALGLPIALPGRSELVSIVFGVVLFSLLGQGLTMPRLLRRLGLTRNGEWKLENGG